MSDVTGTQALTHALEAHRRGYTPLPLQERSKRPAVDWQALTYPDEQAVRDAFEGHTGNLGVILGERSGHLVDVDIDWPRATLLAERFFLAGTTEVISGRVGSPGSHWWYQCSDLGTGRVVWKHPNKNRFGKGKDVLVEIRGTGHQTAIPASIHPNGERYVWDYEPWGGDGTEPGQIRGDQLRARCGIMALVSLLVIEWPGEGSRHDAHLALAGALLAEGYGDNRRVSPVWEPYMEAIIDAIRDLTHDREDRASEVIESTLRKIQSGKPVQGWPTLAEMIGAEVSERARDFARQVEKDHGHERPSGSEDPLPEITDHQPSEASEEGGQEESQDSEVIGGWNKKTFDRMVDQEILRMEVREVARERFSEIKSERQLEENPDLVAEIRTAAEVILDDPPEPGRIDQLLPWNSSMLLVAQRKTGKTIWLANLAHSLLTGEKFLNEFQVRPLEPSQTIALLNFEVNGPMMADDLRRRGVPLDRVIQIDLRGKLNPFKHPSIRKKMTAALREMNVTTVMVDTFAQAFTGDSQNDTAEVGNWLRELNQWVRSEVGALDLILTAHAGWDGDRARGSSGLEDWADSIVHLKREDKDDLNSMRMMRANGREDVRLDWGNLPYDHETRTVWFEEIDQVDKVQEKLDRFNSADDAIRTALTDATEPLRSQDLVHAAGMSPPGQGLSNRALDQARQRLVDSGELLVTRGSGRGNPMLHALNPGYVPLDDDDDGEGDVLPPD